MHVSSFIELIGSDALALTRPTSNPDVTGTGGGGVNDHYRYIFIVRMECAVIATRVSYVRFLGEFVLFV